MEVSFPKANIAALTIEREAYIYIYVCMYVYIYMIPDDMIL